MFTSNLKYCVGLDVAKDTFKACLSVINREQKITVKSSSSFANTTAGFATLQAWVHKHRKEDLKVVYVMEATGVYHEQLAWYLHGHDCLVSVLLPTKAKRYLQSLGLKSKNDQLDAQGLSYMGCQQVLSRWQPLSKELYQLRQLTRFYESLQTQRTFIKNQLHALSYGMHPVKLVKKQLTQTLMLLEKQLGQVEEELKTLIEKDPRLRDKFVKITKIKGVGLLTFAAVVAETGGFALFENQRQLVSYAGYDVVEHQSGQHQGKTRISKKGNARLRRALHMAALGTVKNREAVFISFYERIYERTRIKMKAYVAVQKKLLCLIYALWKNDTPFDPQYLAKNASGIQEPKPLFPVVCGANLQNKVVPTSGTTQDELPCNHSPEALFPVVLR
jgi:transposase